MFQHLGNSWAHGGAAERCIDDTSPASYNPRTSNVQRLGSWLDPSVGADLDRRMKNPSAILELIAHYSVLSCRIDYPSTNVPHPIIFLANAFHTASDPLPLPTLSPLLLLRQHSAAHQAFVVPRIAARGTSQATSMKTRSSSKSLDSSSTISAIFTRTKQAGW
ncbi:hypothetical protein CPB83DRAFT_897639 [Crepidotus variabilis]|uniref:Uncharacterized protein n=1 Tax=Crepidotus variabilis TaxID=179855 RepID=A0A9P6E8L3_9AGAR|nr:hypothetical protein CPB83DRAFT_897639 [Crepidotus variabilis]